jgi:hypothetical protein
VVYSVIHWVRTWVTLQKLYIWAWCWRHRNNWCKATTTCKPCFLKNTRIHFFLSQACPRLTPTTSKPACRWMCYIKWVSHYYNITKQKSSILHTMHQTYPNSSIRRLLDFNSTKNKYDKFESNQMRSIRSSCTGPIIPIVYHLVHQLYILLPHNKWKHKRWFEHVATRIINKWMALKQ